MRKINRLIAQYCPLGVAFKKLGDLEDSGIVKLGRGNVISKSDLANSPGDHPVYSSSAVGSGEFGRYSKFMFEDERISWSIDGGGRFFYRPPHKYSVTNVCGWLKVVDCNILNTRFLYHALSAAWEKKVFNYINKAHPSVIRDEYCIPLPPIEIQDEIVRILDAFTSLTAELTAELNARKRQYNYYRDRLLSFAEGEVEWKTLPEMALDFGRGKSKHRPRNDERLYGGDIPFIQTGDIRSASHIITQYSQTYSELGLKQSKLWPKGTLCITIAANIAETSILGFDACFPDSVIGFVADPKKTSSDYVEYLLQSTKNKLEEKGREKSSAQSNINLGTFEQLKLPFPSLAEQARIVAILDKFDALTSSLTEGLPREIALRQKQYEHYRDLLLSFQKPKEVAA